MSEESWSHYFDPDETLLWEGRPIAGIGDWRIYNWSERILSAALGALGLVIGKEAILDATKWLSKGNVGLGLLILGVALPFILAGTYVVFLQWPAMVLAYKHKRYALTNRAAYIMYQWPRVKVKVLPVGPETIIELVKGRRSFSVWASIVKTSDGDGGSKVEKDGFENISEGQKVYNLIRELQKRDK